jgi:hypothetical protein
MPSLDEIHIKTMTDIKDEPIVEEQEVKVPGPVEEIKEDPVIKEEPIVEKQIVEKPEPILEEPIVIEPEPILDTDISKPGQGKVAIKNSDGVVNYFNNVDEIPEDFEPATYKEFGKAMVDLTDKRISDKKDAEKREESNRLAESQKEVKSLTDQWDNDITVLTKGGILPEDAVEREKEIGDVYAYMGKKAGDGVLVDSFAEAHKAMKYEQLKEAEKIVQKAKDEEVKEKGGKIMSGNGGTSVKTKTEPLPMGVGLDAVHARYSQLL